MTNYIGKLIVHKEYKQFAVCTAQSEGKLTIPFEWVQQHEKSNDITFTESYIVIDKKLWLYTDDTEKYKHIVVIGDTRRDAEIVDITDASPNNKVKVQYLDDGQQEDLDLTKIEWRSTHGKKRAASSARGNGKDEEEADEDEDGASKHQCVGDGGDETQTSKKKTGIASLKMPATVEEEAREWLTSIGLDEYANQVIGSGLKKLKVLKSESARNKLEERCRKFMDEFEADMFVEEMDKFREATVSVDLADIRKKDPSVKTDLAGSSLRSAPSLCSNSGTDKPDLAAAAAGTTLGAAIEDVAADRTAAINLKYMLQGKGAARPASSTPSAASQGMLSPAASVAPDPLGMEPTDPLGLEKVLDLYAYDGPALICGNIVRLFQKQVPTAIKNLDPLPKKTICAYDDKGQLGKSDLVDMLIQFFAALMFEQGDPKVVLAAIKEEFANNPQFRKWRVIVFNLTRESELYDSPAFTQLLETIGDGSFLGGWEGIFPWVFVIGNRPINYTATTAALGGRILFFKLHSMNHNLVFDRDLAKKVAALAGTAADISTITDESSSTGKGPQVVAFERILEPSGEVHRSSPYMEYTQLIDFLIDTYPTLFKEYRKWGKKPRVGGEEFVYQKTAFHKFILANFAEKFAISNSGGNWTYYVKPKKD